MAKNVKYDFGHLVGHCQTNLNGPAKGAGLRRSGRQLTPLSERGSTVLFEDVAAVEVAVVVEVVASRLLEALQKRKRLA